MTSRKKREFPLPTGQNAGSSGNDVVRPSVSSLSERASLHTPNICTRIKFIFILVAPFVIIALRSRKNASEQVNDAYGHINEAIVNNVPLDNVFRKASQMSIDRTSEAESSDAAQIPNKPLTFKGVLQQRYDALLSSPPPWPQIDYRISRAILEGHTLGVDTQRMYSFNNAVRANNTIVTAYYAFSSKHSVRQYGTWFSRLLRASEPMIIFVEPGSEWFEYVKEKRQHAPTVIASIGFDELVMSTTFTAEYWNFMQSIDLEAKVHKGTGVYKIWNEKLILMHAAIKLNPFNTNGFAWMDAGYFRKDADAPPQGQPIIRVNITERGIPDNKVLVLHVRNDPLSSPSRVNVAGNSFVGTGKAFLGLYPLYYQTFWHWSSVSKFIGSDQFVMTETCRRYPSNCHPFFPGRYKKWFAMAEAMRGDLRTDFAKVSKDYLFLDKPPDGVPHVPSGEIVTYCGDKVMQETKCAKQRGGNNIIPLHLSPEKI